MGMMWGCSDLATAGAEVVLCDLERGDDLRPHLGAADAIVFAAGAGPGSGPERKRTVDYGAAVASMEVASDLGVTRFVIVSSIGTHDVASAGEAMRPYLQAKRDADDALKQGGLDWTIVKPGHLTDVPRQRPCPGQPHLRRPRRRAPRRRCPRAARVPAGAEHHRRRVRAVRGRRPGARGRPLPLRRVSWISGWGSVIHVCREWTVNATPAFRGGALHAGLACRSAGVH